MAVWHPRENNQLGGFRSFTQLFIRNFLRVWLAHVPQTLYFYRLYDYKSTDGIYNSSSVILLLTNYPQINWGACLLCINLPQFLIRNFIKLLWLWKSPTYVYIEWHVTKL